MAKYAAWSRDGFIGRMTVVDGEDGRPVFSTQVGLGDGEGGLRSATLVRCTAHWDGAEAHYFVEKGAPKAVKSEAMWREVKRLVDEGRVSVDEALLAVRKAGVTRTSPAAWGKRKEVSDE